MSRLMTKPTKWHVHPAKTQISLGTLAILLVLSREGSNHKGLWQICLLMAVYTCPEEPWNNHQYIKPVRRRLETVFEPCHEIMALSVLCKCILPTCMRTHQVGLDDWFSIGSFVYFHTSCVRTPKALARLHGCAGSPNLCWSPMW